MTPKGLKDPPRPRIRTPLADRWTLFLGEIAAGTSLQKAMHKCSVNRADIEACTRKNTEERSRWNDARLAARKRKWNVFMIEEILGYIAGGMRIKAAIIKSCGHTVGENAYTEFTALCTSDPDLREQYFAALKSSAVILGEDLMEIADDKSGDIIEGPKGALPNHANVQRDKLRVETRRGLMGSWFPRLFAEKQQQTNIQVNVDYAAQLEKARQRVATNTTPITQQVMEAAFRPLLTQEAPAQDTYDWDDKSKERVSSLWREED